MKSKKIWTMISISVIIFILGYWLYLSYEHTEQLPNRSCDYLLNQIKSTTPNYDYDVRAWIGKECWKQ